MSKIADTPKASFLLGQDPAMKIAPQKMIYISPSAFVHTMATLLWNALRHPFKTTEINLSTGKVIRRY